MDNQISGGRIVNPSPEQPAIPTEGISAGKVQLPLTIESSTLTPNADEIALYDRQIRLWGVQAQEK